MSIFEYQEFQDWEGFTELNMAMLRLRGTLGDHDRTKAMFEAVPAELQGQSLAYLLEYSLNSLSRKQFKLATELGAFDLISQKNSVEVALRLRNTVFTSKGEAGDEHLELLAKLAADLGDAFVVDTMHAAFDGDLIEQRLGLKSFPSAQQKADGFARNLKLVERFIEPHVLTSPKVGNIAFRQMAAQETSTSGDADFSECIDIMSRMEATDLKAVAKVLKEDVAGRAVIFAKQIDRALRHDLLALLHSQDEGLIFDALQARPITGLTTLLMLSPGDLTALISGVGLHRYANGKWIGESNLDVLLDRNVLDLINLFNDRLGSDPYFPSNVRKPGGIYKPSSPGIPFLMLAPVLNKHNIFVDLKSKYAGNQPLASLAKAISSLNKVAGMGAYVKAGVEILTENMASKLAYTYKTFSSDKFFGKDIRPHQNAENPDGVSRDYQIRFAAVRICAEMHQQTDKKNVTWEKKYTPFQYLAGKIHKDIDCKEALLELVKSYDEETILDALVSYKPGIMPLIELGVLDRKHMNKLTMKERGKLLEADLGM